MSSRASGPGEAHDNATQVEIVNLAHVLSNELPEDGANRTSTPFRGIAGDLDSACTRSVVGLKRFHKWVKDKASWSPTDDSRRPLRGKTTRSFLFGDGGVIRALFRAWLPIVLCGANLWLEVDVVPLFWVFGYIDFRTIRILFGFIRMSSVR